MNRIQGKTVLITGASSGIGQACAFLFAGQGARLILAARRTERLEQVQQQIVQEYPDSQILLRTVDIREYQAVYQMVQGLPTEWQDIDILINNAGLSRGLEKIHQGVLENWQEMIDTNIKGLLYATRCIAPGMVQRGTGMIINIASIAGREVYPAGNVYCATKSAVKAISQGSMIDLNGTGVRVVNIDPGLVETEFSIVRFRGDEQRAAGVYKGYTPLNAMDVAEAALFCANRPPHVNIADILIMPTDQASTTIVNKKQV
jgi:NADP-dependent 3-hydroxy acid dehydrogenase YdfG